MITKNDAEALIETQVAKEIFEGTIRQSKALSMFRRLPNATSDKTKLRVLDSLPMAYFVDETTNNGRKNLTKQAWANKYINIAEIAVLVPIKENVLNDADINIWGEVRPRVEEAFGKLIDEAIFFGTGKPTDWEDGIVTQTISAGAVVTETGSLYSDINDTMTYVEESGYNPSALVGGVGLKGKFRMMTDTTGQPLNTTEIGSLQRNFMDNGAWDKATASLLVGDFKQAVFQIRQDLTFKVLTEGVIQDPSTGEILYNLGQDDMVALRCVMRLGWQLPNPVNALNGTETRFPFAVLVPSSNSNANSENEDDNNL